MGIARRYRDAMGIAARPDARRPALRLCSSARRVHVDRLHRPSLSQHRQERLQNWEIGFGGGNLLTLRRLGRDGSPGGARSPAPDSPGPPRFEPSTRVSFRKRVGFANLNRRPDRKPVYRAGLRRKPRVCLWFERETGPRQFPLRLYSVSAIGFVILARLTASKRPPPGKAGAAV